MHRIYVVSGSASGIGRATRSCLERNGDVVIGIDRADAEICADLATPGGRAVAVDEIAAQVDGRLNGVVACAGVSPRDPRVTPEEVVSVNYFGAHGLLVGLLPLLAPADRPRAVVVSFGVLLRGGDDALVDACIDGDEFAARDRAPTVDAYASAKRAIAQWVRRAAVADEWAGAGIALNAVAPGIVSTAMTARMLAGPDRDQVVRDYPQPLGGIGRAEDVASLIAWLVRPANGFVTGQVVFADGGYEALVRRDEPLLVQS